MSQFLDFEGLKTFKQENDKKYIQTIDGNTPIDGNISFKTINSESLVGIGNLAVKDGITPTIGSNENWFIGNKDTGKPSRGPKGNPSVAGNMYGTAVDDNGDLWAFYPEDPGQNKFELENDDLYFIIDDQHKINIGNVIGPQGEKGIQGEQGTNIVFVQSDTIIQQSLSTWEQWSITNQHLEHIKNIDSFRKNDIVGIKGKITDRENIDIILYGTVLQVDKVDPNNGKLYIQGQYIVYNKKGDQGIPGPQIDVIDNLTTDSNIAALSAKQGKILNDTKQDKGNYAVTDGENTFNGSQHIKGDVNSSNYLVGKWLRVTDTGNLGSAPPFYGVIHGDGWLYKRTLDETKEDLGINNKVSKTGDTISGNLTVSGDLTVQGKETILNTQTVNTKDNIISLASGRETSTPITGPVGLEVANYKGTDKTGQLVFKNDGIAYVGDSDDLQPLATRGNVTTGDLITWDDSKQTLIPVSTSFPILKPLYFKNCNGLIVNSNNKNVKVWEVMDDSNYASHYGFYELYNGAGTGNDNSLQLYADNQNGANKLVREVKQDGTVYYKTPVHVEGAAGDHNLISREICGSNDNGLTTGELYLNYHVNNPVFFGSDANSTLDANGGITVNGPGVFKNTIHAYRYTTNNNAPFITFDKPGSGAGGIGSNGSSMTIQFGSVSSWNSNSWDRNTDDLHWRFRGDVVTTTNLNIKDKVIMEYNSTDDCLEFVFK